MEEESDEDLIGSALTTGQHAALTTVVVVSSVLSIAGSTRIVLMTQPKWRSEQPYHRIMAGLSLVDVLFSLSFLLQPFLIVSELVSWPWAIGTTWTCSLTGFLSTTFALAGAYYSCLLSLSFVLFVSFRWTSRDISRWVEFPGHIIAWIVPASTQIPATITNSMNPSSLNRTCSIASYPSGCTGKFEGAESSESEDDEPCLRGDYSDLFFYLFSIQLVVATAIAFLATLWVYISYRSQAQKSRRFDFQNELSPERRKLLDRLVFRAVFYSLAYLNTIMWPLLDNILRQTDAGDDYETEFSTGFFIVNLLTYALYPLQGFLNYLIYVRQDMMAMKRTNPEARWRELAWKVWCGELVIPQRSSCASNPQLSLPRKEESLESPFWYPTISENPTGEHPKQRIIADASSSSCSAVSTAGSATITNALINEGEKVEDEPGC